MPDSQYDVLGIGNAIVDVIARTEDDFLVRHGMNKGTMALIDEARADAIYQSMGPSTQISGGSGANTIAGVASFGARAAFIGKVKDDTLGKAFTHDIRATGVSFTTKPATDGPSTARCYVLVTGDGERTMNTYLGAAQNLTPADIDEKAVAAAEITYLEGYLWDPPQAKEAFRKAAQVAHSADRLVALTLSDAFCVDRYRDEFLNLMRTGAVDLIFANERELTSLYQTSDFNGAVSALQNDVKLAAVTRSEKGCVVVTRESHDFRRGGADPATRRCDWRGRPVRGGLPDRPCPRPGPAELRAARRHRCGRGDPAPWGAAERLAESPRGRERLHYMRGCPSHP